MKHSLKATEFWFTLVAYLVGLALIYRGDAHNGVVLLVGAGLAYGLSRGVAKHGYGKALNKPNVTRI
jgi:predicted lysophospholipase L1 biosynthesis ABC-type transport system permease subunit